MRTNELSAKEEGQSLLSERYLDASPRAERGERFALRRVRTSERKRQKGEAAMRGSRLVVSGCIVALLLLLIPLASADILISNPAPHVGDLVHIKIIPALQDQHLIIITPKDTYRFIGGMPDNAAFVPDTPGMHIVRIVADNVLVDTANFTVSNGEAVVERNDPVFSVSSNEIKIGEPLIINAPVDGVSAIVVRNGDEFSYPDAARPVTFIAQSAGALEVILRYTNGTSERTTVTVKETDPLIAPPILEQPLPSVTLEQEGIVRQATPELLYERPSGAGRYDIEVKDVSRSLRNVRFKGLAYTPQTEFRIMSVVPGDIRGNAPSRIIDAFAIDPTGLAFESASFTFTAVGTALYKCKEYNYTTQTCFGENKKIMDLVPGQTYTLELTPEDPLFSQTGYLTNPNFDTDTGSWTTLSEGPNAATFTWTANDAPQSGVAEMAVSGSNRNGFGNYYQEFNLTVPAGTTLAGINFSALWRVSTYHSQAGNVYLWIQDVAQTTTLCSATTSFSSVTSWATIRTDTGVGGCNLASFTTNTNYTFRVRCQLNTGAGGGSTEVCRWDNASVAVWYNDTTAPTMRDAAVSPDPVNFNQTLNITVNITDNIAADTVLVEIAGANYTMADGPGDIYYYDDFNTSRTPGLYQYRLFFNDTNNNRVTNISSDLNFTIRDVIAPNITLIAPANNSFTTSLLHAQYNLSDQVGVDSCSLNVSGTVMNSTSSNPLFTPINLTATLASDGIYLWNVTCNDTSGNVNTSEIRIIYRDAAPPIVQFNTTNNSITGNTTAILSYTPRDMSLSSCSLWGNFSGTWSLNQTNSSPLNNSLNSFSVEVAQGAYLYNILCTDMAGNAAFNSTNYTLRVDHAAPQHSGISVSPASGVVYANDAQYHFNITWTDNTAIDVVLLESNFTGTLANVTPTRNGDVHMHTFTDRPAGSYVYRWYANDTAGNRNQTSQSTYTIAKATPVLNLTLNGSYANVSVGLNAHVNATGTLMTPANGYLELYEGVTRINSGQSRLENVTPLDVERRYNFTVIYNATQNYTEGRLSLFADVIDTTTPTVELGNPANNSVQLSTVVFYFTPRDNVEIANCTILLDGMLNETKDVSRNALENITVAGIADGTHNWTVSCTDTTNNSAINTSYKYFTVDTQPPTAFTLYSPAPGNVSANLSPLFIWNQTSDITFDRYTIQVDNDVNFGSINHQANTTPITNTSQQFTLLDQAVWHWRVIAYDQAGNSRTTDIFNYTADATAPNIIPTTANNSFMNVTLVRLNFTVTDFTAVQSCSLYINGSLNQTNGSTTFFDVTLGEGNYLWSVWCNDTAGNAAITLDRRITIDTTAPADFVTLAPANNTITNDNTPEYSWQQSSDANFANYTVQISDVESFVHVNHTLMASSVTNTSINQSPELTDGVWYWRVIAFDLAGNQRIVHPTLIIDTTPPATFDLVEPANDMQQRNATPLLLWQQSSDTNFANYTVLVSDDPAFGHVNYSNTTFSASAVNATITFAQDVVFYWKVVAYDLAGNSRNSTSSFLYLADFASPIVTQVSPANATTVSTSPLVSFRFNVTDSGTIVNCSLYINGTLEKTLNNPLKDATQTINHNLENGDYTWRITCTDTAGNTGNSSTRLVTLNVQVPALRLYESAVGATTPAAPGLINLSRVNDSTESSVTVNMASGQLSNFVNATYTAAGEGVLIFASTQVNFSGVFSAERTNEYYITWKAHVQNSSGWTLLCQSGDDGAGGTIIPSTAKATYAAACTTGSSDVRLLAGDNITLTVNIFKSGGPTRNAVHYWEGVSWQSYMQMPAYELGTLTVNFTNFTDPRVSEDSSYIEQCNVTCESGTCLNTEVTLQRWDGNSWVSVGTAGNITLNGTQINPESRGNINGTNMTNFSLYGSLHSNNNTLRCVATSTYSNSTSSLKNVSVVDRLAPSVTLNSPSNGAAFEPQNVTFQYTPFDKRLTSCSLYGNWSGSWAVNQTQNPVNGSVNSFSPIYLDYGIYGWNVQCSDSIGNSAFASSNFTLYVAGDVEVRSENITFSAKAVEGKQVTIYANITNRANRTEPAVTVRFWRDSVGGLQIGTDQVVHIDALSYNTTSVVWTPPIGTFQIYVTADADDLIVESDEGNNEANRSVYVSMWQVYYGNVSGNVTLGTNANDTFVSWSFINRSGNIFIADTETTNGISFAFLQPLGRNTTGGVNTNTLDDFSELDTIINTTSFVDSVNDTYTVSGAPHSAQTFSLFSRTLANVAVNQSSANFATGVLWDADDSSNAHYDATDREDVVFITRIHNMSVSPNGVVDYEIITPSRLKEYNGAAGTVSFYYEIE